MAKINNLKLDLRGKKIKVDDINNYLFFKKVQHNGKLISIYFDKDNFYARINKNTLVKFIEA